ncbi:uncharacterized protein LOC115742640 [Rhodamnia argentea]|uniref:Uncharacterized protein LOC115742640 n=1 Tax=Rhodamnia argentea TaxID=178133 RepID=A0ABM3HZL6_9MYRT|nr:uncharacterized protein LOC115742640 [Rhodamnia argentea]
MDNLAQNKGQPVVRKVKKKQGKDELDRLKQAEKKKRRLEKALATSAAIRAELEKKKLKKQEEQQKLDEEGAAIAEAVALQVLLGEDSDDACKIVLNEENEGFNPWDSNGHFNFFMDGRSADVPCHHSLNYALDPIGWISHSQDSRVEWGSFGGGDWGCSDRTYGRDLHGEFIKNGGWTSTDLSPGLIAAQAVSSLRIREDGDVNTIVLNGMLRG